MDQQAAARILTASILDMLREQIGEDWPINLGPGDAPPDPERMFWATLQEVADDGVLKFDVLPESGECDASTAAQFKLSIEHLTDRIQV